MFLYLRISVDQAFRRVNYIFLVFVLLNYLVQILIWIFQCDPVHKAYDVSSPADAGECWLSVSVFTWYNCAGNVFMDLVLLSFPIWMMWGVPVARGQKLWVVGIFIVASLLVILTICFRSEDEGGRTNIDYQRAIKAVRALSVSSGWGLIRKVHELATT